MNSNLNTTTNDLALTLDFRALKAMLGVLAIVAAGVSAVGVTVTASLFGALAASALSAGAAFAALVEPATCDHRRSWRVSAWIALGAAWIIVAANLLNAPLGDFDGMRIFISVLIAASAGLRASRWRVRPNHASLGMVCALVFALLALAATWSSSWAHGGDPTAINLGCSLELAGSGALWLAEAIVSRLKPHAAGEDAVLVPASGVAVRLA